MMLIWVEGGIQMLQIRKIYLTIMKFYCFQQYYYKDKSIYNE